MDKDTAVAAIEALFSAYKTLEAADSAHLQGLDKGKLYELYVLSELIRDLKKRGCKLCFNGSDIVFKAAPGKVKKSDPHFVVFAPHGRQSRIFVDIEFETLGRHFGGLVGSDRSSRHELDIVVVDSQRAYPSYDEVLLGVECKSQASFSKDLVKEVLGVRRELSFLWSRQPSRLSEQGASNVYVPAEPASEFWLAYHDPKGSNYRLSPRTFGVEFRYIPLP